MRLGIRSSRLAFRQLTAAEQSKIVEILKRHPRFDEDFAEPMPTTYVEEPCGLGLPRSEHSIDPNGTTSIGRLLLGKSRVGRLEFRHRRISISQPFAMLIDQRDKLAFRVQRKPAPPRSIEETTVGRQVCGPLSFDALLSVPLYEILVWACQFPGRLLPEELPPQ